MFGKNPVVNKDPEHDGKTLKVNSIFPTIQGEGPDAGKPAIFVRLADCNLRCYFCDTDFSSGEVLDIHTIVSRLVKSAEGKQINTNLVVITGGEPFIQNIIPFVDLLNSNGFYVSVETAGTVSWKNMRPFYNIRMNKIICSPKTPKLDERILPHINAFKYIIKAGEIDDDDGLPILSTQRQGAKSRIFRPKDHNLTWNRPVYIQPMDEHEAWRNNANRQLCLKLSMKHGYRISLQMHKLLGTP